MRDGEAFKHEEVTKEKMSLKATANIDQDVRNAIIDEESGIMKSGALPQISTATPAGTKNLLSSITQAGYSSHTMMGHQFMT